MSSTKEEMGEFQDEKWQYSGNREDLYNASTHEAEYSPEEKALLRKIDLFVMPIICILNFLQYLDKSTINYAAVLTFKQDLGLSAVQFSFVAGIFYLGFLLFQLPNNYMLQRLPLGKYIGSLVVAWGVVLLCTAFCNDFSQVAALRFLLGFFEAGIYPSLTLLVATFYRRSEQVGRLGVFLVCNSVALIVGGLTSYGAAHMTNDATFHSWQWLMIILGSITAFLGLFTFFFLIDSPKSPMLRLNAEEEILVEERAKDNATVRTTEIKMKHIWTSLKEIRYYCFMFSCLLLELQNGAISVYSAQLAVSFGFNALQSILISASAGIYAIFLIAFTVYIINKTKQTFYTAIGLMVLNNVGIILLITIPVVHVKLVGYYFAFNYSVVYIILMTSIANNVTGYTKKIFYNGSLMIFYTIGNFAGPFMMVAPPYLGGMLGYLGGGCIVIILLAIARWRMAAENRKRLLLLAAHNNSTNVAGVNMYTQEDISDDEDKTFIYLL